MKNETQNKFDLILCGANVKFELACGKNGSVYPVSKSKMKLHTHNQ